MGQIDKAKNALMAELESLHAKHVKFLSDRDQQANHKKLLEQEVAALQDTLMASRVDDDLLKDVDRLNEEKSNVFIF